MNKMELILKHCYGINNLEKNFNFKNRTFAIYAPNGAMKTSFAKTFDDCSKGEDTTDLAFTDRKTVRKIMVDGKEIDSERIFVIEPYNQDYESGKMSTLLASRELKEEYDSIHKSIEQAKNELVKKLKQLAGIRKRTESVEGVIEETFGKNFYDSILEIETFISESDLLLFHDIQYQIIFDKAVVAFLNTEGFKIDIKEYIENYDKIIEQSQYLKKNFNLYHAEKIQQQLETNNFFKAGHSVNLSDGNNKHEYSNSEKLKEAIAKETERVLNSPALQASFGKINTKIGNAGLRSFRDYLFANKEILPELADLPRFARKIWCAYFVHEKELFLKLTAEYKKGQEAIEILIKKADAEQTDWKKVVDIFNERFIDLPFSLSVKNRNDVILKKDRPTTEFIFKDGKDKKIYEDKKEILKILSTGEQKALYILNIIFEVEIRKKEGNETLFVIDDIADSFDYKNKYAIVEYLKYMSEIDKFYMLILTHNFDFFRTLESRYIAPYGQCLMAVKNTSEVKLEQAEYINNPFIEDWKKKLTDHKKLVASIPFVRNIIEYTRGEEDDDYLLLTSVLHHKKNTEKLTLNDIKPVFEKHFPKVTFPKNNLEKRMLNLVFETADECLTAGEGINLENKIVLSIASRLKAEQFMKSKITDRSFSNDLDKRETQTWILLKEYIREFNNEAGIIKILKKVQLITPANIHVNSFMYEPILDMGDGELKELYRAVKETLKD